MPVIHKLPLEVGTRPTDTPQSVPPATSPGANPPTDDGTRALLQAGSWIMLAAVLALISTETLFGGIGIDGPHTNAGWLSFMFAMMGIPFGLMLLVLGVAKWLRKRRLQRL